MSARAPQRLNAPKPPSRPPLKARVDHWSEPVLHLNAPPEAGRLSEELLDGQGWSDHSFGTHSSQVQLCITPSWQVHTPEAGKRCVKSGPGEGFAMMCRGAGKGGGATACIQSCTQNCAFRFSNCQSCPALLQNPAAVLTVLDTMGLTVLQALQ